jgi:hypothetical protein
MPRTLATAATLCLAFPLAWGCASDGTGGKGGAAPGAMASAAGTAGSAISSAAGSVRDGASAVPGLVNVNLKDVLNDLALDLKIDRANVPITIQLPITLAANVCGVSVNVLSASAGGQANCTANTAPVELAQVVQQQMAGGGSVGGGAQGGSTAANSGSPTSGATTGGAANTSATSAGSAETTTTTPATAPPTP